jgi:hypothetical protein
MEMISVMNGHAGVPVQPAYGFRYDESIRATSEE